ncbi:hypothetical protein FD14_GL000295 [Secundilactobacillus similis DSM 23365 = JCM 2765]|uniref:Uncharacterized protein n=1 Tax=Secundilactobacillus similis DSM 23365 = JCM 2765 TaxID=1423804 RepID=A0A0R2FDD0_9LACO|nr:hypothetical protein FD14_GL000295 [Secundilactobacillus similis DSM 23365 = JCM 2765]
MRLATLITTTYFRRHLNFLLAIIAIIVKFADVTALISLRRNELRKAKTCI